MAAQRPAPQPPASPPPPLRPWLGGVKEGGLLATALAPGCLSGLLAGLAFPGHGWPLLWLAALAPLLAAWLWGWRESSPRSRFQRLARWWLPPLAYGLALGALSGGWVANTAHVYGQLPLAVAWLGAVAGYGGSLGAEALFFLAPPVWLAGRAARLGAFKLGATGRAALLMALLPLWSAGWQALLPRMFHWSYGQLMWQQGWLVQAADLLGSAGLNLIYLPGQLALAFWLAQKLGRPLLPPRHTGYGLALGAGLLALAAVYGAARYQQLDTANTPRPGQPAFRLLAIQPNFALELLVSNPALVYSQRQAGLGAILQDTQTGLEKLAETNPPPRPNSPLLVVWPESVYPYPFTLPEPYYPQAWQARRLVEEWQERHGAQLLFNTVEADPAPGVAPQNWPFYGAAVHLAPQTGPRLYKKIFLIPFGETIPGADWFPAWRRLLKAAIPQISEFTPGQEHTVFELAEGLKVAPLICFDATRPDILRGMAANGAGMGVVMANLAWFGKTSAGEQFFQYARFRAIENRLPVALFAQSGPSGGFDALGRPLAPRLELFSTGQLYLELAPGPGGSPYGRLAHRLEWGFLGLALALAALALPMGRAKPAHG